MLHSETARILLFNPLDKTCYKLNLFSNYLVVVGGEM